ncbi:MAG: cell division protein ZapD [Gammaproteobacteria bacterium]|nr:cell division protein ZapD [Gammaproteobacteria bacterium]NNC76815.1 cell division protein ZapD [Woeseiaceae bacterium]
MAKPAGKIKEESAPARAYYEQPLNERMRTFMRLEFLYQQILYNSDREEDWATRATISTLLEILAILSRGDLRSEVHKELDHQLGALKRFQSQPGVDSRRLDALVRNLSGSRDQLASVGTSFLQTLKESEFLSAIKHRSAIPGGTCEFDLPEYSHWLRQPYDRRKHDLEKWLEDIRPLCDAVSEVLWLIRESAQPADRHAVNGMYQHNMQKDSSCRLIRVSLANSQNLFPEISGSQHRFTVRFLEWSTIDSRAVQTGHDVDFQLSIC